MKTLSKVVGIVGVATILGVGMQAQAIMITPSPDDWWGEENDPNRIYAEILELSEGEIDLAEICLYKAEVPNNEGELVTEEGPLLGSYQTSFSNSPLDPSNALIEYTGGDTVAGTAYLLVKDGKNVPAWYLYDLSVLGWTGIEEIELKGFWADENGGAISHVALYGGRGTSLPDGGATLLLLGLACAGLGTLRRKAS